METIVKNISLFEQVQMRLADIFTSPRRQELEEKLSETQMQLQFQRRRTGRFEQRYDDLDKRCAALENEINGLRTRLYTETQRADAFKAVVQMACASSVKPESKQIYEIIFPFLDKDGFLLFYAAQELTSFRLYEQFPYEESCGCFEFADGFTLMRYLEASEFDAVEWEVVPDTTCEKATLQEVDKSTPEYREFERQLYFRVLKRMGLQIGQSVIEQGENMLSQDQQM